MYTRVVGLPANQVWRGQLLDMRYVGRALDTFTHRG